MAEAAARRPDQRMVVRRSRRSPGSPPAWPRSATTGPIGAVHRRVQGPVSAPPSASRSPRPYPAPPGQRPGAARRSRRAAHSDAGGQLAAEGDSPRPASPKAHYAELLGRIYGIGRLLVQARRDRPRRRALAHRGRRRRDQQSRRRSSTPATTRVLRRPARPTSPCGPLTCRLMVPHRSWAIAMPRPATPTITAVQPSSMSPAPPRCSPTRARPSSTSRPRSPTPSPRSCGRPVRNCTARSGRPTAPTALHGAGPRRSSASATGSRACVTPCSTSSPRLSASSAAAQRCRTRPGRCSTRSGRWCSSYTSKTLDGLLLHPDAAARLPARARVDRRPVLRAAR